MQLFASIEESARAQFGSYLGEDFYWGTQLRYLHRRFIANEFYLTDILTEDAGRILSPADQNSVYVEPSIMFAPENDWKPERLDLDDESWRHGSRD